MVFTYHSCHLHAKQGKDEDEEEEEEEKREDGAHRVEEGDHQVPEACPVFGHLKRSKVLSLHVCQISDCHLEDPQESECSEN